MCSTEKDPGLSVVLGKDEASLGLGTSLWIRGAKRRGRRGVLLGFPRAPWKAKLLLLP